MAPAGQLQRNSVGFGTVLMQSIAQIAPAVGILTTLAFNTREAGIAAPSAYLLAFLLAFLAAYSLAQLGRHLPSAGGFFTYVSYTVGPRSGILVGWLYACVVSILPGGLSVFTAYVLQVEMQLHFGLALPWPLVAASALCVVAVIGYRGIKVSGKFLTVLSIMEMLVLVALAISGVSRPGPGGVSFAGLLPPAAAASHGYFLAVVLSIFAFTGWEGAAAIAEEARNPRKAVPRAIICSVMVLGAYYVFCSWGIQLGWGTDEVAKLAQGDENPAFIVAQRLWGPGWVLVLLALLNSCLAVCIACTVDSSRNWYAMSRAGVIPPWFGSIHARYRTPHHAVLVQLGAALLTGLGLGWLATPEQAFFTLGTLGTIIYVIVYSMGNLGVMRLFLGRMRGEFNVLVHVIFPLASTLSLFLVLYLSFVPLPDPPVSYAPLIAAAMLVAGIALLWKLHRHPNEAWKTLCGTVIVDEPQAGEDAHAAH